MAARKPRKYAFVPRLLVRTAVASVIPACAVAVADGCGGATTTAAKDGGQGDVFLGVAAVGYPAYDARSDVFVGVAAVAYPAYEAGVPEAGVKDAAAKDTSAPDVGFGVAAVAYPAYEAGSG
jgi:hypothetical protein